MCFQKSPVPGYRASLFQISRFYITVIVIKVQFVRLIRNDIININNFYTGPLNLVMFSRPKARCDLYLSDHRLDF